MSVGPHIFVIGSFVIACSAKVERLPVAGESLAASAFVFEAGGKGFNLAAAARRLGAEVDGVIGVGDDDLGALAGPALARAGLPAGMLERKRGPTGAGVGFIASSGETSLAIYGGANLLVAAGDAERRRASIRRASIALAQFEAGDAPILAAFALARGAGVATMLNPSPFRTVSPALLELTSILVVNAVEARGLAAVFGIDDAGAPEDLAALAGKIHACGPQALVVTLGAEGAIAFRAGREPLDQRAFPVAAVDALGAGDAFAACLAVSLAEGRDWPESMRRAAAAGALVTTRLGVFDALPSKADIDAFAA